jgi:hypothetical protein
VTPIFLIFICNSMRFLLITDAHLSLSLHYIFGM